MERVRVQVERIGPGQIQPLIGSDFVARGSSGIGTQAEVPWIAVFPSDQGASAQQGYYIVYLFSADGSAVHLTLASATENLPKVAIQKRTLDLRTAVGAQEGLLAEVGLRSDALRPQKYEASCAFAISYAAGEVLDDEQLLADLRRFLELWDTARDSGLRFGEVEPLHLVLKWSPDREPETIRMAHEVAERSGSVWWGRLGQGDAAGMSKARMAAMREQLARGTHTNAYLYRRGECWRTTLREITADPNEVDGNLLPSYFSVEDSNLFFLLSQFTPLDADWASQHLVPAANPRCHRRADWFEPSGRARRTSRDREDMGSPGGCSLRHAGRPACSPRRPTAPQLRL